MHPYSHALEFDPSPEWDAFVGANEDPHFEQLSAWGETQRLRGWSPLRVIQRRGRDLTGGAQVLEKRVGRFWRTAYLRRGPLFLEPGPASWDAFAAELERVCRARRYVYFAAVLPYHADGFARVLERHGFPILPDDFPPVSPMKATVLLDVTRPDDDLLAGMHRTTRQNVRKSLRGALTIRAGTRLDVPVFAALLDALCARRGVRSNVPTGGAFLARVWDALAPSGQAAIFVAEAGGSAVAARFVFAVGGWVTDWRHGWSGERADLYPNEALDWHVIRWARDRGARIYDFCGIDTRMARKLGRGEPLLSGEVHGASAYKMGFGGELVQGSPHWFWSANPLVRSAMRSGRITAFGSRLAGRAGRSEGE